ncbi:MAG: hypothetical protein A2277_05190 [Desulfobacterales bacterium RIFOXYA12_FULL_46_15]|nr:MAG: hypothetical protein A2097_12390 [Desulfobacula sp. GWF2_41_7]OGR25398.1 MAG: hypothetical protein A2277_05190 [Desulfobacterales bacterium RIFOXYA12_FULL_46_15]
MNCNEFQYWLVTRDIFFNETPDTLFHLKTCDACKNLYLADTCLEKNIRSGFIRQEISKELFSRIDLAIDQAKKPFRLKKAEIAAFSAWIAFIAVIMTLLILQ